MVPRGRIIQTGLGLFVPFGLRAGALVADCFAIGRTASAVLINPCTPYTKSPALARLFVYGAQGQNRTADTRIFSPLLYRLSYLGIFKLLCL